MGGEVSEHGDSFIKLVNEDDFASIIKMPLKALAGQGKTPLPRLINLRASNIRGRKWKVAVETVGENLFFSGGGWKAFVRDIKLKLGEYVIFGRTGRFEFEASVYEITGCERDLRIPVSESETLSEMVGDGFIQRERNSDSPTDTSSEEVDIKRTNPPPGTKKTITFAKTMTATSIKRRMFIPRDFMNQARIKKSMKIQVRDRKGRSWPMMLNCSSGRRYSASLQSGWKRFVQDNGIEIGNTIVFSFELGGNVLEATIQKNNMTKLH